MRHLLIKKELYELRFVKIWTSSNLASDKPLKPSKRPFCFLHSLNLVDWLVSSSQLHLHHQLWERIFSCSSSCSKQATEMKAAVRALRLRAPLTSFSNPCQYSSFHRFYSAQPQPDEPQPPPDDHTAVFDSSHYDIDFNQNDNTTTTNWDNKYRDRVRSKVFGEDVSNLRRIERELEKKNRAGARAKAFLAAALDEGADEDNVVDSREVKEEDQKSLSVGVVGPPNAGKSALTNCIVIIQSSLFIFSF